MKRHWYLLALGVLLSLLADLTSADVIVVDSGGIALFVVLIAGGFMDCCSCHWAQMDIIGSIA